MEEITKLVADFKNVCVCFSCWIVPHLVSEMPLLHVGGIDLRGALCMRWSMVWTASCDVTRAGPQAVSEFIFLLSIKCFIVNMSMSRCTVLRARKRTVRCQGCKANKVTALIG